MRKEINSQTQIRIGTVLGYVYTVLQSVISVLYIPILLNGIGKGEYGLYQIMGSIISYFSVMEGPLSASILKYYAYYKTENDTYKMENTLAIGRRIFRMLSCFVIFIAIPLMFILKSIYIHSFTDWEMNEALWMFGIMILNVVVSMINYVYIAAINANEAYIFLKLSSLATLCIQPIIVILLIQQSPFAIIIVAVQLLLNIVLSVLRWWYCHYRLNVKIISHGKDKELWKNILLLSISVLFVALADQIFWKMDQLILGAKFGTQVVGIYSIGAQINAMYISVGCILGGVLLPMLTRIAKKDETQLSVVFAKIGRIQSYVICLILSGVFLFGKEFVVLLAGDESTIAYYVALLMMIPYSIDLMQICGGSILQIKDRYYFRSIMMICIAVINLVLTFLFINLYGMIGAAMATAIAILIGPGFIMNYVYSKKIGIQLSFFFKQVFPIWIMALLVAFLGMSINLIVLENAYIQFIVHIFIYTGIFVLGMWIVSNKEEKKYILSRIKD